MIDYQKYIEIIDDWIVNRDTTVVGIFLIVTLLLSGGLGMTATDSGTSQFTENVPAQEAFDEVNDNFERQPFERGTGSTTLIHKSNNVLSKSSILEMLRAQHRLKEDDSQDVVGTNSVAQSVALTVDPNATTLSAQIDAVESAPASVVKQAAQQTLDERPSIAGLLSKDLNRREPSASATIATVTHRVEGTSDSAGTQGTSPLTPIQQEAVFIVGSTGADITVFGSGLISAELQSVISDSLILVIPAAVILILFFLIVSYRDPFDLLIGLICLGMAILWTFGFMGWAGIPFTQMLIAVPPLLLAVGIDFGIHAVNRYREERVQGTEVSTSMRLTTDQLLPAFFIVTGTTVLGFAANGASDLAPIRDFGLVAAVGIVFTFLIFGIFLPSLKHFIDRKREKYNLPTFSIAPIGSEDSAVGRVLTVGVGIARRTPHTFFVVVLLSTAVMGAYGTGVDTRFTTEDFLPPEENPEYFEELPASLAPSEYTVTDTINFLEENFESSESDSVTIYMEGPMQQDYALESIYKANQNPPDSFVSNGRRASATSILGVINQYERQSPEFRQLIQANDIDNNGIPDKNLPAIYDELYASPYGDEARSYLTDDYSKARIVYSVKSDASQAEVTADTRELANDMRFEATATGSVVVLKAVSDVIAESAYISLALAILASAVFLVIAYWIIEQRPSLGIANLVPILVTIAALAATMRYLDIPFNVLTGTTLSIGIGLGIDYSAHLVHRFSEEFRDSTTLFEALSIAVSGTGGALAGSMLTTTTGTGVLVLAITPILGQFGLLIALSVLYSFVASVVILPTTLVVWDEAREVSPI
ncbi:Predicted exporter protein, RND superfamily [Halorientalis persicus]|jgi:predicted RND superfamily exporter protein|uniref:Predicted exporter protein, RND superfamily n=1 Tax=Halorientalis persicus TaxID=1367881 RepID=A0A1H8QIQ7_9EURY|nr:MMPL family transporter [Halorientalis persicus]SEO53807.1 Predicted exporter protein, RND superfamily [Halorientalis persicus]